MYFHLLSTMLGSGITIVSMIRNLPHPHEFYSLVWERNNIYHSSSTVKEKRYKVLQGMVPKGKRRELGAWGSVPHRRTSFCKGPEARRTLVPLRHSASWVNEECRHGNQGEQWPASRVCTELRWKTQKCVPRTAGSNGLESECEQGK